MRRRSGSTSRRPKLDFLENRDLMSGVPSFGAPAPSPSPILMVIVGNARFAGGSSNVDSRSTTSRSVAGANASWNLPIFEGGRSGGDPQYGWGGSRDWGGPGGWGGSFHHGFEGVSSTADAVAPPRGPGPSTVPGDAPGGP